MLKYAQEVIILSLNANLQLMSKRLQLAMSERNLSYGDISAVTGIPKSAVHRYISGETPKIPLDRLEKLSSALGVSASWVMGWVREPDMDIPHFPSPSTTEEFITFPVIGEIAAGYDSIALESWDGDTIDIPASFLKGHSPEDFFVLKVKGDSMYPMYHENDKVLILKQSTLNYSGQVGAVLYDGELATIKKVEFVMGEDWMKLVPINPLHPPKLIENADLERCQIIGVPKYLIREIIE